MSEHFTMAELTQLARRVMRTRGWPLFDRIGIVIHLLVSGGSVVLVRTILRKLI